jgi:hypothetical protein
VREASGRELAVGFVVVTEGESLDWRSLAAGAMLSGRLASPGVFGKVATAMGWLEGSGWDWAMAMLVKLAAVKRTHIETARREAGRHTRPLKRFFMAAHLAL